MINRYADMNTSMPQSANELSHDISRIAKKYGMEDLNSHYRSCIERCMAHSGITAGHSMHKSVYKIDDVINAMGDAENTDMIDAEFTQFFLDPNFVGFLYESSTKRTLFDNARASNFMYMIADKAFPPYVNKWEPGQIDILFTKYIRDRMEYEYKGYSSAGRDIEFHIEYEDLYGEPRSMHVLPEGALDAETLMERPQDHWVGQTYFDSFYMYPFYKADHGWSFIPMSLIRAVAIRVHDDREDGEAYE